jgi:anti-anti-sigma factor
MDTPIFPTAELTDQPGMSEPNRLTQITGLIELVRGNEQILLAELSPLVRRQNMTLDLCAVERIDAAGIAALIALYAAAREAGYRFTVANPSPHVAEILALVGLERILVSHNAVIKSHSAPLFLIHAA